MSWIQLKRSHSTSSLHDGSGSKSGDTTPPPAMANGKSPNMATPGTAMDTGSGNLSVNNGEPEVPLKKRRGSGDTDVKSPGTISGISANTSRGLGFGQTTPPITAMTAGFGSGKMEFGGLLGGGMEMEEEIL